MSSSDDASPWSRNYEIARYFLRLGATGFGGPLALVGQMQMDLVENKRWITPEKFQTVLPFLKSMPGPLAFQTAMYLGGQKSGRMGATLAGICLILPAMVLILLMGVFYQSLKGIADFENLLSGLQAGAVVMMAASLEGLTKGYTKRTSFWLIGAVSFVLLKTGLVIEPLMILAAGAWSWAVARSKVKKTSLEVATSLLILFWICFKAGAFVFGTGLAFVPLLEGDFVQRLNWVTHSQFMDALAFGQMTPGPVSITVTFLGFQVMGLTGAAVATLGIFLPSALHQLTWFPRVVDWLSAKPGLDAFLVGALAAVSAAIVGALLDLARVFTAAQFVLFCVFFLLVVAKRLHGWRVVVYCGVVSLILSRILSS